MAGYVALLASLLQIFHSPRPGAAAFTRWARARSLSVAARCWAIFFAAMARCRCLLLPLQRGPSARGAAARGLPRRPAASLSLASAPLRRRGLAFSAQLARVLLGPRGTLRGRVRPAAPSCGVALVRLRAGAPRAFGCQQRTDGLGRCRCINSFDNLVPSPGYWTLELRAPSAHVYGVRDAQAISMSNSSLRAMAQLFWKSIKKGTWGHGLFDVCDIECLLVCCCPCIAMGQISSENDYTGGFMGGCLPTFCGCVGCQLAYYGHKYRGAAEPYFPHACFKACCYTHCYMHQQYKCKGGLVSAISSVAGNLVGNPSQQEMD